MKSGIRCTLVRNRRIWMLLMGLAAVVVYAATPATDRPMAPDWTLQDPNGAPVSWADFAGKVVLLDFWATWCPPCRAMIPGMVELQTQYADQGLVVVGLSLDHQGADVVRRFAERFGVNYQLVMGDNDVANAFGGIHGIPTSFLIDRQGRIIDRHTGYLSKSDLKEWVQPHL